VALVSVWWGYSASVLGAGETLTYNNDVVARPQAGYFLYDGGDAAGMTIRGVDIRDAENDQIFLAIRDMNPP